MQAVDKQAVVAFLRGPGVRTLARPALAPAMPMDGKQTAESPRFHLNCSIYEMRGATLGFKASGAIYKLSCRFVTVADLSSLQAAVETAAAIRLVFSDGHIVLARLTLQHLADGWTGIAGNLVAAHSTRNG